MTRSPNALLRVSRGVLLALVASACAQSHMEPARAPAPAPLQLFILAGQSNMAGRGAVEAQDRVVNPRVFMLDRSFSWIPAVDPVHFDKPSAGVGPGRSFGVALADADSSARIGLVPVALGGSPISSWRPGAEDGATGRVPYDDAIARANAAMQRGELKAILWHQGESDSLEPLASMYESRLRTFIERFRKDLGKPDLPFLIGQLGRFDGAPWSAAKLRVDAAHRRLAAEMRNVVYVSSEGLKDKGDTTHFDSPSARELGRRYAAAYLAMHRK
jgi:Carbohydrate esterase, sialic acid-specific acetylesterase